MRKQPYTVRGIRRVPCAKCGEPSRFQWQICANNREFQGICEKHDVELNDLVLKWLGDPDRKAKMKRYKETIK